MKKINHRERRESSACTGSVSRTAMLRGSLARPSLPPPPPSRDEHREHNRRHVVYNFALLSRKLAPRGAGPGRSPAKILQRVRGLSPSKALLVERALPVVLPVESLRTAGFQ